MPIRKLQKTDINRVAEIWLTANRNAHAFIPAAYWESHLDFVKNMLPQTEVYVYETNQTIQGFIGINGESIEGIFVANEMQSHGIGKLLLDFLKEKKTKLSLDVYQKNTRAIRFYQREGFQIQCEGLDTCSTSVEIEFEVLVRCAMTGAVSGVARRFRMSRQIPIAWRG